MAKACPVAIPFISIECATDNRTLCDRVADVLSESHREDTPEEFRLGLLQGALAIALPQWRALETRPKAPARRRTRSRSHA